MSVTDASAGRGTTGAMRAVTSDQYNRERNLINGQPHYEPLNDPYPEGGPLRNNNKSIAESYFWGQDKSSFMDTPAIGANPYTTNNPTSAPRVVEVIEEITTKTNTSPQPPVPIVGGDGRLSAGLPNQGFNNPMTQERMTAPAAVGLQPSVLPQPTQVPPNFKLISSKVEYDNQLTPNV